MQLALDLQENNRSDRQILALPPRRVSIDVAWQYQKERRSAANPDQLNRFQTFHKERMRLRNLLYTQYDFPDPDTESAFETNIRERYAECLYGWATNSRIKYFLSCPDGEFSQEEE